MDQAMVFHGDAPVLRVWQVKDPGGLAPRIASTCTQHRGIRWRKSSPSKKNSLPVPDDSNGSGSPGSRNAWVGLLYYERWACDRGLGLRAKFVQPWPHQFSQSQLSCNDS